MGTALEIFNKHTKQKMMHEPYIIQAMKEYATECVKASLIQAQESAHQSSFCDSAIDQITDETNIILL